MTSVLSVTQALELILQDIHRVATEQAEEARAGREVLVQLLDKGARNQAAPGF